MYEGIFDKIIEEVVTEVESRVYDELDIDDMIKYAKSEHVCKLHVSQDWMFDKIYTKVADGSMQVIDSIWTDHSYHSSDNKPVFLDVDSFNEWIACANQKDREKYHKNHKRSFKEDSSFYDGDADVYCFGNCKLETIKGIKNNYIEDGFIIIDIYYSNSGYCSDSSSSNYGSMKSRYKKCMFSIKAAGKTAKERNSLIVEMFRHEISSVIARKRTNEYLQKYITNMADAIMQTKCHMEEDDNRDYHISCPINIL